MAAPAITCPKCGFTDIDFRTRGRLGCLSCREVFGDVLGGLLTKVQHEPEHVGRAPASILPSGQLRRRLEAARREMEQAVTSEDFEVAARLRDEISALEQQLTPS
jgi:protein arginine kinase activator